MPLLQNQQVGSLIEFSQGDNVTINLLATDDNNNPINLTGASFSTQIQGPNIVGPVTFPNGQHTLQNQTSFPGCFMLTLTQANTESCGLGANKEILTEVTISGLVTYFRGENLLTVYPAIPTQ
jgi:hypothetical protein